MTRYAAEDEQQTENHKWIKEMRHEHHNRPEQLLNTSSSNQGKERYKLQREGKEVCPTKVPQLQELDDLDLLLHLLLLLGANTAVYGTAWKLL